MKITINIPTDFRFFRNIFSSLRSRNYRIYFTGQGVSLIGTWMQNIALSWLVYRLTNSVFLLGFIGFISQIPTFILAPFTGVVTDRLDRLKIMKLTQVGFGLQALVMTLLVMLNQIEVWHIIVLSLLHGILSAFDAPARQSLVIDLLDNREDLGNAIALNSAIFNGARLIGPAIAGITIAAVGEGICFLLNTVSFGAVIIALMQIRIPKKKPGTHSGNFLDSFTEGFRYTFRSLPLRFLIIELAFVSLIGLSYVVLLPAYAKEILNGGSDTLGFLMSAMGTGALAGALFMAARKTVTGLGTIISVCVSLLGIAIVLASLSRLPFVSMVIFSIGGFCMVLSLSSVNILIQTLIDEDKRGRVMSLYAMALMGTAPIGNLLTGSIASGIGLSATLFLCGAATLISGIWFGLNLKNMQRTMHPIFVRKGIVPSLSDEIQKPFPVS